MIVDTDVLMWYMKGKRKARKAIDDLDSFSISAVNYMELIQGLRASPKSSGAFFYFSTGKIHGECGSLSLLGLHFYVPIVVMDDSSAYG